MIELNDNTWNDFISKNEKVLVDVYGDGCGPCLKMDPILLELESQSSQGIWFGKINGMNYLEATAKFGIRAVPTLLYFKSGELMHKEVGFKTAHEIQNSIQNYLL